MITQRLIAEKAGVSFATVSRALTHSAKVRPETLRRIRGAMTELGVSCNDDIFLGRSSLSKMVLVVVGSIVTEFFAHIIMGIYEGLRMQGYNIVLCVSNYDSEHELADLKIAEENGYAGVIMITAAETPELTEFLQNTQIPTVLVNRYIRSLDLDVVRIDNYRGGYLAARYLVDNGHKHIAHLAGPRNSAAPEDRLRGFSDAMRDNGTVFSQDDVVFGDLSRECGKHFANWIATRDYTAVYIGNDYMTAGFVYQIRKLGRQIPEDISVVCFDDSPLVNSDGLNITSISCDPVVMGRSSAEMLLKRITDPLGRRMRTIYSPKMCVRESVCTIR